MIDIRIGHVLDELAKLPAESVQCVVTSPPYWGLRDYGLEPVVWGGESGCGHQWGEEWIVAIGNNPSSKSTLTTNGGRGPKDGDKYSAGRGSSVGAGQSCLHCGAWRGCLGLEPTPELYVEHLVSVFHEVRRVLRGDGTAWLNLGDSYATGAGKVGEHPGGGAQGAAWKGNRGTHTADNSGKHAPSLAAMGPRTQPNRMPIPGLKAKDLVMIPARVALALQADGWYLRSEIVWAKPNPMPESVRDRPTKAHEMVYLLSNSPRYYYDWEAVAEPAICDRIRGPAEHPSPDTNGNSGLARRDSQGIRNLRSVWTISTAPYPEAHFATFPPALVEPCIKAGTAPGDTVLDPFAGSGTVGEVARKWGRNAILIEAQPKYRELIEKRLRQGVLIA